MVKLVNKVIVKNETVLDLTSDTVTSDKLAQGYTAHDKAGNFIVGTMQLSNIIIGYGPPSDDIGNDGDIYIEMPINS